MFNKVASSYSISLMIKLRNFLVNFRDILYSRESTRFPVKLCVPEFNEK